MAKKPSDHPGEPPIELLEQAAVQFVLGELSETEIALAKLSEQMAGSPASSMAAALQESLRNWTAGEQAEREFRDGLDRLRAMLNPERSGAESSGAESSTRAGEGKQAVAASSASGALGQDPELVSDFILESREHLRNVESGLLVIEKNPSDSDALNAVFRSFHTIKGLSGFLEFGAIQEVSHEVETILHLARTGQVLMNPALIDLTLEGADYVSQEILRIEAQLRGENERPATANVALLERLKRAANGELVESESSRSGVAAMVEAIAEAKPVESRLPMAAEVGETAAEGKLAQRADGKKSKGVNQDSMVIRVETAKLDYLLDMVGEMVIAESMVRLDPELAAAKSTRLQRNLNQLRRVTEEVQKVAMATRLVPVGTLFQRVNRLVRDTARKAGKLAELELVGEDTQLDKTIIEELTDPIMHMVRNSIDHGIETPEARRKAGKPEAGKVTLKAYRQADHIQIEIADDGRGLNIEGIRKKALERGLIGEGSAMSEAETFQLIFEPGFSTAEKVTDISGRGVGMDVVKKQIQKLRGKIDIKSRPGQGTTFYLKLPLTLAIIEGLVIGVGRERYILPIYSVHEMFRPRAEQLSSVQGRGEMVMVRNHLLPVIRLHRALHVKPRTEEITDSLMIVAETEGKRFVLSVDEFIGKQEVVIKSLGASLKNTQGIAGGAILGDGRVGLILDLEAIYRERTSREGVLKESLLTV